MVEMERGQRGTTAIKKAAVLCTTKFPGDNERREMLREVRERNAEQGYVSDGPDEAEPPIADAEGNGGDDRNEDGNPNREGAGGDGAGNDNEDDGNGDDNEDGDCNSGIRENEGNDGGGVGNGNNCGDGNADDRAFEEDDNEGSDDGEDGERDDDDDRPDLIEDGDNSDDEGVEAEIVEIGGEQLGDMSLEGWTAQDYELQARQI